MNNKIKMFDFHSDTILDAYLSGQPLTNNNLHIAFDKAEPYYEKYTQVLAVFSNPKLNDDEAYERFFKVADYLEAQKPFPDFFNYYLAVEGANLLGGDITRLDELKKSGVKLMTLVWGGYTCIGGAHNDGRGLTEFGREVVKRCFEIGIIPDISHSSDKLFWETAEIADSYEKPIIATHSNSRALCEHNRCLTDDMFIKLVNIGGIAGISLVNSHLTNGSVCNIDTLVSHIEHYISLGGTDAVCLGCDWDGTESLPDGISNVGDIWKLADRLAQLNYTQEQIKKIFNDNAQNFMSRNVK